MQRIKGDLGFRALQTELGSALAKGTRLETISGSPPDLTALPTGCAFAARCKMAQPACEASRPDVTWLEAGHSVRCLRVADTLVPSPV